MATAPKPRRARSTKAASSPQATTGAVSTASTVQEVVCPATPRQNGFNATQAHQTHGGYTPLTGPITSVSQLTNGGRSVAKGSMGSFETMEAYSAYLRTLATHELHRHAVSDARIVPIDDRERLIRRLEAAWTTTASKFPGRASAPIPSRVPFTKEQIAAQDAIKHKMLRT